jgi:ubiquinone/menaquinone biosynthesis C-methylase UbiE
LNLLSAFLELFFTLLYNQLAWLYDWIAAIVSVGRWQNWVVAVIPYLDGPRVLELGFGPGHLQLNLSVKKYFICGIDASRKMGKLAHQRLHASGCTSNLVRGLGQNLPFAADSFNQIVSTFPSRYIFDEITLAGILRVLKPGGMLVVLPVAWIIPNNLLDRMAAKLFRFTGQATEWNTSLVDPFIVMGFQIKIDQRRLASSEVLIIIATKPS